jgi:hypothetical protein
MKSPSAYPNGLASSKPRPKCNIAAFSTEHPAKEHFPRNNPKLKRMISAKEAQGRGGARNHLDIRTMWKRILAIAEKSSSLLPSTSQQYHLAGGYE